MNSSSFLFFKNTGPKGTSCCTSSTPSHTSTNAAATVPATPYQALLPFENSCGKNFSSRVHSGTSPIIL